jgi:hypothetical protein
MLSESFRLNVVCHQYAHIGGEVSSHKSQLKTWEEDLKDFKDINKRYTEQLIRVKVQIIFSHILTTIIMCNIILDV